MSLKIRKLSKGKTIETAKIKYLLAGKAFLL